MIEAWIAGTMSFRESTWLWALLLPLFLIVLQKLLRKRQKQGYADGHLWAWVAADNRFSKPVSGKHQLAGWLLNLSRLFSAGRWLVLAWICIVIALAGPRSLDQTFEQQTRQGIDVMVSMDLSQSMQAEDVVPSRFTYARTMAESLVNQLQESDRISLSVFAGKPHSVVPLSHDKRVFKQALKIVKPGMMPTKGSWLEAALLHDLNLLTQTGRGSKVLVVFTDGAPRFWKPQTLPQVLLDLPVAESQRREDTGVKVIYVGVGLTRSATLPDESDKSGHLHVNGLLVQSRLEEPSLMRLAQITDGVYLRAESSPDFMAKLMNEITISATESSFQQSRQVWTDYAYPFVVAGLISLLMAFYGMTLWQLVTKLFVHLYGKALKPIAQIFRVNGANRAKDKSLSWLGVLLVNGVLFSAASGWSTTLEAAEKPTLQQAYEAFQNQSYELAESLYDAAPNYDGWFGAGASAYKLGDLETAALYFRQAAWSAQGDQQRAQALYNLGNSFYKANLLPQAIESYQQALLYQSPYANAEHNLALAQMRHDLEMRGKMQNPDETGEGEGKGSQGRDSEGAFYGGQKPNSESSEAGVGADGDSEDGDRHGKKVNIPEADALTDYSLNPSIANLRLNSQQSDQQVNRVLQAQQQKQRAEKFEHQLQKLNDDQQLLLKRIFEREEGFHAQQQEPHLIPGVQPW